jgi:hypothetical protein
MRKLAFVSCALLLSFEAMGAPLCPQAVDRELQLLGMGSFEQPAAGVTKKVAGGSFDPYVEFSREAGRASQLVGASSFLVGKTRIYMATPSLVFGRAERKQLILNEQCKVESVELVTGGTAIHFDRQICEKLEGAKKSASDARDMERRVREIATGTYWVTNSLLVDAVEDQCAFYRGQMAYRL